MAEEANSCVFALGTFNVLAPCHKRERTQSGSKVREARYPDKFLLRHQGIVDLLRTSGPPDVVCLQEFSSDEKVQELFEEKFSNEFTLHFYQRPNAYEGLLIMVKKQLVVEQVVRQELAGSWNGRIALHVLISFGDNRPKVLISTTHLEYPHYSLMEGLQVRQVQSFLSKAKEIVSNLQGPVAVLLCGDFNTSPGSSVYNAVCSEGYMSTYNSVHQHEPKVTHRDHRGNEVAADYIFYRVESSLPLHAALHPAGLSDKEWPSEFELSDHRLLVARFEVRMSEDALQRCRGEGDPVQSDVSTERSKNCTIT